LKATEARLLDILKKSPQFVISIYQRTYSWEERECQQLWYDIIRTGRDEGISAHFVGSIVYVEKGLYSVTSQSPLLVIDGQQRLTTISLLLEALARSLGADEPLDGFSARKIRNYYLVNPEENGDDYYKLILTQTDKETLRSLVSQKPLQKNSSVRIESNFNFFQKRISELNGDLTALCKGIAKLVIVDISLNRDQDNAQLIFESLNSTGRELSQADLIRNYILMGLEPVTQTKLYEQYWRPMELEFGQQGYVEHFDSFMRHYLTLRTGEIPKLRKVYEAFKEYTRTNEIASSGVENLVADIQSVARYYCAIALLAETDADLKAAFHDIGVLKVDVALPLLLELYEDYTNQTLNKSELVQAVRLVESYVFRRAVCGIPTNSMNKTFSTFTRPLKKDRYIESVKARFLLLQSYRRFPTDDEFKSKIINKDLYNFRSRTYWLRRMENYNRKEYVSVGDYTIEHILPQNENLSVKWQNELGYDWKRIQKEWLHTLGNLTLTGYNPELSDRPFIEKRDIKGGFAESPLRLNRGLGNLDHWNEETIKDRAQTLAKLACDVWTAPSLPSDILNIYKQKTTKPLYSIENHPNLTHGPISEVFKSFRNQVLDLDSVVTEEFLKLYVAYKAETNFVDVVPQARKLCLYLNISFSDIDDPKGICKDVSSLGKWGNGDVEVEISTLEEIPYVMNLIQQALENQLGDGDGIE
jgi:uncharacterized protein with ParB-like and HNH nuclease domain/predicted transport protein